MESRKNQWLGKAIQGLFQWEKSGRTTQASRSTHYSILLHLHQEDSLKVEMGGPALFSRILFSFCVLPMILVCLFEDFILSRVVCSIINIIFIIVCYLFSFTENTELPLAIFVLITVALCVLFCFWWFKYNYTVSILPFIQYARLYCWKLSRCIFVLVATALYVVYLIAVDKQLFF